MKRGRRARRRPRDFRPNRAKLKRLARDPVFFAEKALGVKLQPHARELLRSFTKKPRHYFTGNREAFEREARAWGEDFERAGVRR